MHVLPKSNWWISFELKVTETMRRSLSCSITIRRMITRNRNMYFSQNKTQKTWSLKPALTSTFCEFLNLNWQLCLLPSKSVRYHSSAPPCHVKNSPHALAFELWPVLFLSHFNELRRRAKIKLAFQYPRTNNQTTLLWKTKLFAYVTSWKSKANQSKKL